MKHVLLIAPGFPPCGRVGAHRPARLAKYLPQFGWQPMVVCKDCTPDDVYYDAGLVHESEVCETLRIPWKTPRSSWGGRATYLADKLFPYTSPKGLFKRMLKATEQLLSSRTFDVVYSTYRPGFSHQVASLVSRRHGLPWVADFRDLPDRDTARIRGEFLIPLSVEAEKRTCRQAASLVTVSQGFSDRLMSRHHQETHIIHNSFDTEDYRNVQQSETKNNTFTLSYFGVFYDGHYPIDLFAGLDLLLERKEIIPSEFSVEVFGANPKGLRKEIEPYRCKTLIQCHPRITYREVISRQMASDVLLLASWRGEKGVAPAKIYEYFGANRPILNVPGDNDIADRLIKETGAGVTAGSPEAVAAAIAEFYGQWRENGRVEYCGIPDRINRHSSLEMARQFANLFDAAVERGATNDSSTNSVVN